MATKHYGAEDNGTTARLAALEREVAALKLSTAPQATRDKLETTFDPRGMAKTIAISGPSGVPVINTDLLRLDGGTIAYNSKDGSYTYTPTGGGGGSRHIITWVDPITGMIEDLPDETNLAFDQTFTVSDSAPYTFVQGRMVETWDGSSYGSPEPPEPKLAFGPNLSVSDDPVEHATVVSAGKTTIDGAGWNQQSVSVFTSPTPGVPSILILPDTPNHTASWLVSPGTGGAGSGSFKLGTSPNAQYIASARLTGLDVSDPALGGVAGTDIILWNFYLSGVGPNQRGAGNQQPLFMSVGVPGDMYFSLPVDPTMVASGFDLQLYLDVYDMTTATQLQWTTDVTAYLNLQRITWSAP